MDNESDDSYDGDYHEGDPIILDQKDVFNVDTSSEDEEEDGRRSPTESLLIRRRRSNMTQEQSNQHGPDLRKTTDLLVDSASLCGGDYELLDGPPRVANSVSLLGKRQFLKTPSPPPGPSQVRPPQSTPHKTYRRTFSSPHLSRSPPFPPKSSFKTLHSSFNRFRESGVGSPSISSATSSDKARLFNDPMNPFYQPAPQASPTPSSSRCPRTSASSISDFFRSAAGPLKQEIEQRRPIQTIDIPQTKWTRLYETIEIGSLPSPEECHDAPPTQKHLASIPILKATRKNSILGHYYLAISELEFQCQVMVNSQDEEGSQVMCGKTFKKSGGSRGRLNHIMVQHENLYLAQQEFLTYQQMVRGIEPSGEVDDDCPPTPQKSRYQVARDEVVIGSMKKPLPYEQELFEMSLLRLIASEGASFQMVTSELFRSICGQLNPLYTVPCKDSLKRKLDSAVKKEIEELKVIIKDNVRHGAITADSWTSIDQRKFFGVTFHFVTHAFKLTSVVIGIERIVGPQTSEVLLEKLKDVLEKWRLSGKLISGTTDQGANIKKAMEDYQRGGHLSWIPCASHKIQLCINKSLDASQPIKALITKCQDISTFFRNCNAAMTVLDRAQDRLTGKRLKFLSVSITRWNSKFEMVSRVVKLVEAIKATHRAMIEGSRDEKAKGAELGKMLLDDHEVDTLREFVSLLQPAANFTHWAGSVQNPTVSQLYPKLYSLLPEVTSFATEAVRTLHGLLERRIKESWALKEIPDAVLVAFFLNPAQHSHKLLIETLSDGETLYDKAKRLIKKAIMDYLQEKDTAHPSKNVVDKATLAALNLQLHQFRAGYALAAFELYTNQVDCTSYQDSPQDFWHSHVNDETLGCMAQVALSYLCIQATSTECERLFSKAGLVISPRRTRMSDNNFRNIIFLSSFQKLKSENN